jgi:hypothetical protein
VARTLLRGVGVRASSDSGPHPKKCDAGLSANVRVDITSRTELMMKTIRTTMAVLGAVALAACGGTTSSPPNDAAQITADSYQALGQDMATTVAEYQSETATIPDPAACAEAEARYAARMGPMIDRMHAASADMDRHMAGEFGPDAADMACVAAAMEREFERHRAVGCASPDVALHHEEARQHGTTMAGWIDHQRVRYEQMGEAIGMMPPTSASTWTCTQNPDDTFTMHDDTWTPPQTPPSTTTPPTPTSPTPTPPAPTPLTPTPWSMPCGGQNCPCDDHSTQTGAIPGGTTCGGSAPGHGDMSGAPMM